MECLQQVDESIQKYYVRIKEQATKCDFKTNLEEEIKQQIELSTNSSKLRKYSFRNPDFLTYARTLEGTNQEADTVNQNKSEEVNAIRREERNRNDRPVTSTRISGKDLSYTKSSSHNPHPHKQSAKKCYRCGGEYPHPHRTQCPAENKTCNNCGKQGHFARCCLSKYPSKTFEKCSQPHRRNQKSVNNVTTSFEQSGNDNSDTSDDREYIFVVNANNDNSTPIGAGVTTSADTVIQPPTGAGTSETAINTVLSNFEVTVKLERQPDKLLIDSGAAVNVLTYRTFTLLNRNLAQKLKLQRTATKILTYRTTQQTLKVKGKVDILVETGTKITTEQFYVIDTESKNLLSGETALKLNLLHMPQKCASEHINKINSIPPVKENRNKSIPERLKSLVRKYKNSLFNGRIGKFKNFKVKLHINDNIAPTAQKRTSLTICIKTKSTTRVRKIRRRRNNRRCYIRTNPMVKPISCSTESKLR